MVLALNPKPCRNCCCEFLSVLFSAAPPTGDEFQMATDANADGVFIATDSAEPNNSCEVDTTCSPWIITYKITDGSGNGYAYEFRMATGVHPNCRSKASATFTYNAKSQLGTGSDSWTSVSGITATLTACPCQCPARLYLNVSGASDATFDGEFALDRVVPTSGVKCEWVVSGTKWEVVFNDFGNGAWRLNSSNGGVWVPSGTFDCNAASNTWDVETQPAGETFPTTLTTTTGTDYPCTSAASLLRLTAVLHPDAAVTAAFGIANCAGTSCDSFNQVGATPIDLKYDGGDVWKSSTLIDSNPIWQLERWPGGGRGHLKDKQYILRANPFTATFDPLTETEDAVYLESHNQTINGLSMSGSCCYFGAAYLWRTSNRCTLWPHKMSWTAPDCGLSGGQNGFVIEIVPEGTYTIVGDNLGSDATGGSYDITLTTSTGTATLTVSQGDTGAQIEDKITALSNMTNLESVTVVGDGEWSLWHAHITESFEQPFQLWPNVDDPNVTVATGTVSLTGPSSPYTINAASVLADVHYSGDFATSNTRIHVTSAVSVSVSRGNEWATAALDVTATAADVQTALNNATAGGAFTVTGGPLLTAEMPVTRNSTYRIRGTVFNTLQGGAVLFDGARLYLARPDADFVIRCGDSCVWSGRNYELHYFQGVSGVVDQFVVRHEPVRPFSGTFDAKNETALYVGSVTFDPTGENTFDLSGGSGNQQVVVLP